MRMHFPSCKFCLKKRLGEPAQFETRLQFETAHQLVRTSPWLSFNTMNLGGHGKLVRIAMGIFQVRNGHVQTRKDDESKVRKGELSKVMIGIAE
jgi:ABC-type transport system involved in cytochrome c biogenesis ATPase subunit